MKRSRLKPVSKKRLAEKEEYKKAVAKAWMRAGNKCEAPGCKEPPTEPHHCFERATEFERITSELISPLCHQHHLEVTGGPGGVYNAGLREVLRWDALYRLGVEFNPDMTADRALTEWLAHKPDPI